MIFHEFSDIIEQLVLAAVLGSVAIPTEVLFNNVLPEIFRKILHHDYCL